MTQHTFAVDQRAEKKAKYLRREGLVPGNVFGKDGSVAFQMNAQAFRKLHQEVGETGLIYLEVAGSKKQRPVLIEEIQVNPVTGDLVHVSFKQVDLTNKIKANVPVETVGKFELAEATLVVVKDEIEVEALPTDLPEKFEIDVSVLNTIGQMVTYKDLHYDRSKVELVLGAEGEEEPVVVVQQQRAEEVEEAPAPAEGEGAEGAEGAAPATEGEAAAEGAKPADDKAKPAEEKAGDKAAAKK
jgi:large subunit ribosomal protein L25